MSNWNRVLGAFASVFLVVAVLSAANWTAITCASAQDHTTSRKTATSMGRSSEPTYYMVVFAYETTPRAPQTAHTFATFIKSDRSALEAHTISWFPRSNMVRLLKRPEPGVNLDLQRTIENANAVHAQI